MDVPPRSDGTEQPHATTPQERREQELLSLSTIELTSNPGWGERLLPYFVMGMESCWIGAILIVCASLKLFQTSETLIPLWVPFIFMAGAYWLAAYLERRALTREVPDVGANERGKVGTAWLFTFIAVITLFVVWSSVYTSSGYFFDPRWLGALLNDILLLDGTAFHVALILALSVYFCWRGIRIARRVVEPADVFSGLRTGAIILLVVILIHIGTGASALHGFLLVLLLPLFFTCSLIAHALAQALFIRRAHTVGLQGSAVAQERSLLTIISGVGLVLLVVALLIAAFASPQSLAIVQQALSPIGAGYDLLVSWVAYAIVFLLTPLFWLITSLHLHPQLPVIRPPKTPVKPGLHHPIPPPPLVVASIPFIKVLLPVVFVGLMVFAILAVLRMRRVAYKRRAEEQHESLWSWHLFWRQLTAFFLALWRHFFPGRPVEAVQQLQADTLPLEPSARTIREVYRAFLRWAASRGYPRKKDETPDEFKLRLDGALPTVAAEVVVLTEAYTVTRYGEAVLDDAEVRRVQGVWGEMQRRGDGVP